MNLFDHAQAQLRKEEGMQKAASAKSGLLAVAQTHAVRIAKNLGTVNSDQVAQSMADHGFRYEELQNASGSVFRGDFEWTGQVTASQRPSTHGRMIKVWRLKNA
jgi:hypothetical protein